MKAQKIGAARLQYFDDMVGVRISRLGQNEDHDESAVSR
jgi:hypothetical protein